MMSGLQPKADTNRRLLHVGFWVRVYEPTP